MEIYIFVQDTLSFESAIKRMNEVFQRSDYSYENNDMVRASVVELKTSISRRPQVGLSPQHGAFYVMI